MMKVKAAKDVHIRSGEARRNGNANLKGILHKGFSIEVVETKTGGEDIDGNNIWYKDKNGDWYWSGGFEESISIIKNNDDNKFQKIDFDWSLESKSVPEKWRLTKGEGIKIGILDSGISSIHPNLLHIAGNSKLLFNACGSTYTSTFPLEDKSGHGTRCIGVINGIAGTGGGINGMASMSEVHVCKVDNEKWGRSTKHFINSIDHLVENIGVDIISISVEFGDYLLPEFKEDLKQIAEKVVANEVIICVAARDNDHLLKGTRDRFPLFSFPNVLGIGCIDDSFFSKKSNPKFIDELNFLVPLVPMPSTATDDQGRYSRPVGSSFATPWVAAIVANMLSSLKTSIKQDDKKLFDAVKEILNDMSEDYSNFKNISDSLSLISIQ